MTSSVHLRWVARLRRLFKEGTWVTRVEGTWVTGGLEYGAAAECRVGQAADLLGGVEHGQLVAAVLEADVLPFQAGAQQDAVAAPGDVAAVHDLAQHRAGRVSDLG